MERLSALYASALFELAIERDNLDESLSEAIFLRDVLQDTDVMRILLHPQIPRNDKHKLLTDIFTGNIQEDLLGFLNLAIEKNRQAFIVSILDVYIKMIEKHKSIITAKVISATELDDKQATEIRGILSGKLGKEVRLSMNVDPSVVAGPYIYVDGYYLDWTFKTRLHELAVYLKEGVKRT